jgi:hypothetical protein
MRFITFPVPYQTQNDIIIPQLFMRGRVAEANLRVNICPKIISKVKAKHCKSGEQNSSLLLANKQP